jgi:CheY-specific phosphatase CheX
VIISQRNNQDLALTYIMVNEARFKDTRVLELIGNCDRAGTRMASEPKNLVAQNARTEMRKSSFANQVTEPWNSLPTA